MSKKFTLLIFPAITILCFQNCSMHADNEKTMENSVFTYPGAQQPHEDRDHGVVGEQAKRKTTSQALVADRAYVDSALAEIFNNGNDLNIINNSVVNNVNAFGTPCSIYMDYATSTRNANGQENETRFDSGTRCAVDTQSLNAPINPDSQVTREAYLSYTCESLIENTAAMDNGLRRIASTAPAVLPQATDANILKLFSLFYRYKPAPQAGFFQAMKVLFANSNAPTRDEWKAAFYTLCVSGHWQTN